MLKTLFVHSFTGPFKITGNKFYDLFESLIDEHLKVFKIFKETFALCFYEINLFSADSSDAINSLKTFSIGHYQDYSLNTLQTQCQ